MMVFAAKELTSRGLRGDWAAIRARLGRVRSRGTHDHIWLHAASNGELTSARPVIEHLVRTGRRVLVTVNTDSALELAQRWDIAGLSALLAPVDLGGPTRRVVQGWTITAHITFESDLWPMRVRETPGPVIVLGARLTARSARGWQRFGALAQSVLEKVTYLSAQDHQSLDRFASLGLKPAAQGPVFDLKALYTPPGDRPDARLLRNFDRPDTWCAASTHPGEDEIVLDAHLKALQQRPALKLILAPRHPKRAPEIAAMIRARGLTCARRSARDDPAQARVYLADTLGEMHLWYALSGVTFVAGSLTDRGGHTPYEPAAFASAILHGPDIGNFRAAYQRLENANAAICVGEANALAHALTALASAKTQQVLADQARVALRQDTDFEALMLDVMQALEP
ncbi:3-deoxy-D-manno-octulosonic acid transferase [Marivita sp. S2033]|uniref:3-deoxy-D-manno-octulosonic acid transferase n=1 Tax=Marivita sp. S2033 TaxID=3373187 RepID=UPI003982C4B2